MSARLLLSCGEPSGDLYAGALLRELRAIDPGVSVSGLGGPEFASAGGHLLEDYRDLAVTGLTGPLASMPRYFNSLVPPLHDPVLLQAWRLREGDPRWRRQL